MMDAIGRRRGGREDVRWANEQVNRLVERLEAAQREFEQAVASVSASDFYKAPAEGEWTAAEIVAHMCESPPRFMAKVIEMAAGREPVIGRNEEEQRLRLEEVSRHAGDGKQEALERLRSCDDQVAHTLRRVTMSSSGTPAATPNRA